jgi:putative ABC transport system permease protein
MTALMLAMLRARRGQTLALWLLAVLATAAAVAAPIYLTAIDRAVVAGEVRHAGNAERTLWVSAPVERASGGAMPDEFERLAAEKVQLSGFVSVFSTEFLAMPDGRDTAGSDQVRRIAFREDLCAQVVVVAGRCLMGGGETVLSEAVAKRLGLTIGDRVNSRAATFNSSLNVFVPAGQPWTMTVVGLVRPRDPAGLYWGRSDRSEQDYQNDPMYVARNTLAGVDHTRELQSFEAHATEGAITIERLPALRGWLADAAEDEESGRVSISTALPDLLDRIDRNREQAHRVMPLAAIPVVVLAWAVILLAVANIARAHRYEFGVVALRGVPKWVLWWLAAGETVLAVLAGAPVGVLLGRLVVGAAAPAPAHMDAGVLPYAAIAVLGSLLAGLAVQLRTVSAPVVALLRDVDRGTARVRTLLVETLFVLLAGAAVLQQRSGVLTGVTLVAPALVIAALALIAARLLRPLSSRLAARSLRRGALVAALTAFRLARRPAAHRLLVLLVVALGSLGFAGLANVVADRDQQYRAELTVGAPTVLSIGQTTRTQLLQATRAADPEGRYAMAAVPIPAVSANLPSSLAVDSTRLAAVADWRPDYAPEPVSALASRLRPVVGPGLTLTGATVDVDLTAVDLAGKPATLTAVVTPAGGVRRVRVDFGPISLGRHTYTAPSPACAAGCRLVSMQFGLPTYLGPPARLTLHAIQGQPFSADWRMPSGATAAAAGDGLEVTLPPSPRREAGSLLPPDVPAALALVSTGPLPPDGVYASFDGPVGGTVVGHADRLPRLGRRGSLVDLEAADRAAADSELTGLGEVWLARDAPMSIVEALTAAGLTIVGRRTVADERTVLGRAGSALALRFFLFAGALSVLLGVAGLAVTAITAPRGELAPLRIQGLPASVTRRVEWWSLASLVIIAVPIGAVCAGVAWLLLGAAVPQ